MKSALIVVSSVALIGSALAVPKPPKCPVCHMELSKVKSKKSPTAVRLTKKGPIYYCCAGCKMPASVLVKPTVHHKKKK
ncbi:MAG TPA: hypothetical protein VG944_01630 [Fimbriimonas sp.]|nr:hypothetical protein [Fimbriimonas sp.]